MFRVVDETEQGLAVLVSPIPRDVDNELFAKMPTRWC